MRDEIFSYNSRDAALFLRKQKHELVISGFVDDSSWGVDNVKGFDNDDSYDISFKNILQTINFTQLLSDRKGAGKLTHVLDLFGSGNFLHDYSNVDSVTGMRLEKRRSQNIRSTSYDIVSGDCYSGVAWTDLRRNMQERNIPAMDIIVCRPVLPFSIDFFDYPIIYSGSIGNIYLRLFERAFSVLSPGGQLFTEIPEIIPKQEINTFLSKLESKGITYLMAKDGCEYATTNVLSVQK